MSDNWIPCAERMPEIVGRFYLIPEWPYVARFFKNKRGGGFYRYSDKDQDDVEVPAAYWMPKPPPPSEATPRAGMRGSP